MGKQLLVLSVFILFTGFSELHIKDLPKEIYSNDVNITVLGTVYGTVSIPNQNLSNRRFRGSSYRSRGSTTSSESNNEETDNKYKNTVVSAHPISFKLENDISGEPIAIEQKNATFLPNVTPVTVGTIVQFVNNDPFFHNVFSLTPGSKFNIGRRQTGDVYSKQIEAPKWKVTGVGPITLFCDIHSQMKATILSLDTIYYTSLDENGSYVLNDLPDGEYELRVYNPGFDIISKKITIESGKRLESNFNINS